MSVIFENVVTITRRATSMLRVPAFGLAIALASVTWLVPDQAAAVCTVTSGTGTADTPDSGDTVTCSTDAPNPETDGVINNAADNVSVTLQSGAGIDTTGAVEHGILLGDDAIVDLQSGAFINTIGTSARGISTGHNAAITLRSGASISTTGDFGTGINVMNNGNIVLESGASIMTTDINAVGIEADFDVTIAINAGASVTAENDAAIEFASGTITVGGTVSSTNSVGIFQILNENSTIRILEGGSVISDTSVAIVLLDEDDDVTVAGTVSGVAGILLGGGNDRLELQAGFNITGIVNAQGGTDTLVFGGDRDATFDLTLIDADGAIEPNDQFINFENFAKEGSSTWTLSGFNPEITNFAVNGGTLLLDNAALSDATMTVNSDATLAGFGFVSTIIANGGSTISPGAAPGDVSAFLTDNFIFEGGSTFAVDLLDAEDSDSIIGIGGMINGGTVVVGGNLAAAQTGQNYTIAASVFGPVGAGFDGVAPTTFIDFGLEIVPEFFGELVLLTVDERRGFGSVAETFNQQQAAMALDGLGITGDAGDIQNAILGLTAEEARAAFEAIAGGAHAEAAGGALETAEDFTQFLLAFSGSGSAGTATATLGVPAPGYGADLADGSAPVGPTAWFGGFGGYSELDGDGNGGGYEASTFGIAGGVETDVSFADAVLGVAMGYSMSDLDVSNRAQDAHTRNFHAGLYARMGADRLEEGFAARGALTYAHHWLETSRTIAFGAIASTAEADYNGYTLSADGEVRYNVALDTGLFDTTIVSPFVRMQLGHTDLGSFTETGAGALNLSGDADGYNRATGAVGLSFSGERVVGDVIWRPSWSVAYEYAAGDEAEANLTLAGSPTAFVTRAADESRHRIRFGTLSEFAVSDSASFIFATDSVYSQDRSEISAKAGVKFTF